MIEYVAFGSELYKVEEVPARIGGWRDDGSPAMTFPKTIVRRYYQGQMIQVMDPEVIDLVLMHRTQPEDPVPEPAPAKATPSRVGQATLDHLDDILAALKDAADRDEAWLRPDGEWHTTLTLRELMIDQAGITDVADLIGLKKRLKKRGLLRIRTNMPRP